MKTLITSITFLFLFFQAQAEDHPNDEIIGWYCQANTDEQNVIINEISGSSGELAISLSFNNGAFIRTNGDKVNQTLDKNSATAWKVLLRDGGNTISLDTLSDSIIALQDKTSGKCLQLPQGEDVESPAMELDVCDQASTVQQFHLTKRVNGSYKFVSLLDKGFCIDNGNRYWAPTEDPNTQKKPSASDKVNIDTILTNMADDKIFIRADGRNVNQTWDEKGATVWQVLLRDGGNAAISLDGLSDSIVKLQDKTSGKCLQLQGGVAVNGNTMELGDCDQANTAPQYENCESGAPCDLPQENITQQFHVTKRANGSYQFASFLDKRFCIDNGNKPQEDDNVIVWPCDSSNHNQDVIIDEIAGNNGEVMLSFGSKIFIHKDRTFVRADGNNVNQTLDGRGATVWNVLFRDGGNIISLDTLSDSIVVLQDKTSDKCLQLQSGDVFNGNTMEVGNCDLANTAQQFYVTKRANGSYQFASLLDKGFCIDNGNKPLEDDDVIVWPCDSSNHNQDVIIDEIAGNNGKVTISLSFKNRAFIRIENRTFVRTDGNNVNQTLNERGATVWKVLFQGDDNNVRPDPCASWISKVCKYLSFHKKSTTPKTISLDKLSDSIVRIQDKTSGKCLQLQGGDVFNGNTMEVGNCDPANTAQQFHVTKMANGSYQFASLLDKQLFDQGYCIDNGNKPQEDDDIIVWPCDSTNHNQDIIIDRISGSNGELTISLSFITR